MKASPARDVVIFPDAASLTKRAADEFVKSVNEAIAEKGSFTVALAGGSTPKALYSLLTEDPAYSSKIAWQKMHFFFGDERHAPPDNSESNFHMANQTLFSKGLVKPEQITRIRGEYADTEKAALEYEQALRAYFKLRDGEYPRFDLVLLGMGEEGHTLSLFPGTKALHATNRVVVRNWIGKLYTERITLTVPAANQAKRVIFSVTRDDKALALKAVLEGPYEPEQLPAQFIQPVNGSLLWLVDQAAGSKLSPDIQN
ncbi:MAG TPA: 6-phosphogluconolactonase [Verrucomicrobiae bacterium]|nr:6-phosphogluconolactonase [Verrucomicrobiae bacterium]